MSRLVTADAAAMSGSSFLRQLGIVRPRYVAPRHGNFWPYQSDKVLDAWATEKYVPAAKLADRARIVAEIRADRAAWEASL